MPSGPTSDADVLLDLFRREPRSFGFFQSVLVMARSRPDRSEPGAEPDARREAMLLRSWPSLVRSATDIRSLTEAEDDELDPPFSVEVSFMGLYGLSSPVPAYFWDFIQRHPDSALRDFLDIFNSRWIGLFYQAWKKRRWPLLYAGGIHDPMTRRVFALMGLGTELGPKKPDLLADSMEADTPLLAEHKSLAVFTSRVRLLGYAGILSQRSRPPCNLVALLSDYFDEVLGEPGLIYVEENVFQWAYLSPRDINRLGQANSMLGRGEAMVAGVRVPDRMGACRLHVGPLDYRQFKEFLPDRGNFSILSSLARLALPVGVDFDVDLKLQPKNVPAWRLGGGGDDSLGKLGWTTWSQSMPRETEGVVRLRSA